jgi:hypothetical protein
LDVFCSCFLASEEARKLALSEAEEKRTFFPEDIVNSNFHTSLLSGYPLSPWERVRVREPNYEGRDLRVIPH